MRFALFCAIGLSCNALGQVFSVSISAPIPDTNLPQGYALVVSSLPSSSDATFGLQSVCLDINHTSDIELDVKLQSPTGKKVTLFSGVGYDEDNFTGTCLTDSGEPIYWADAPFTGSFRSQMPIGSFNDGGSPNGTWTLWIRDRRQGNTGTLVSFSLEFGNAPAAPFIFSESPLPIVLIDGPPSGISDYYKSESRMRIIDNGTGAMNQVASNNYAWDGPIMAEWQGWSSPNYPKKNIDFNLGPESNPHLEAPLLGLPAENDWILKAEYTDRTLLRNSLVYDTYRQMGRWAPRTRYCEVILDGEYAGIFVLMEKVKRDKNRVDLPKLTADDISGDALTGGYIFEMNPTGAQPAWYSAFPPANDATTNYQVEFKHVYPRANEIRPEQHEYLKKYMDDFEAALHGPDYTSPTLGYRKYADVSSFIDFLLINEFSGNYDSYGRSTYLYKDKITDGGKLHMGPPWDYDRTFGFDYPDTFGWVWEITNYYWPFPFWWGRLWSDPVFLEEVKCRWRSFRETSLSDQAINRRVDSLALVIQQSQARNFRLWPDGSTVTWEQRVSDLHTFIDARVRWMDEQLDLQSHQVPDFNLPSALELCAGQSFDGTQPGGPWNYNWRPGPETPVITFENSGTYELELRDAAGCFRRRPMEVTVWSPNAKFSQTAVNGNSEWEFTPLITSLVSYQWDFGDGNSSTDPAPSHEFVQQGKFLVSLTVTDDSDCVSTESAEVVVNSVGVEKYKLAVFPNPSAGGFVLVAAPEWYGRKWSIFDASGRMQREGEVDGVNTSITLTGLPDGVYYLVSGGKSVLLIKKD